MNDYWLAISIAIGLGYLIGAIHVFWLTKREILRLHEELTRGLFDYRN